MQQPLIDRKQYLQQFNLKGQNNITDLTISSNE